MTSFKLRFEVPVPPDEARLRELKRVWEQAARAVRDASSAFHERARQIVGPEIVRVLELIGAEPKDCLQWGVVDASAWHECRVLTVIAESEGIPGTWGPPLPAALSESLNPKGQVGPTL